MRVGFIFRTAQRTPEAFIAKWKAAQLNERAAAEYHFNCLAHGEALLLFRAFLDRLRAFRVMDPACGSGSFLYLALLALKDLDQPISIKAEALMFQGELPAIGPASMKGQEINSYAAELARVSVWIVETQQLRHNGFGVSKNRPSRRWTR